MLAAETLIAPTGVSKLSVPFPASACGISDEKSASMLVSLKPLQRLPCNIACNCEIGNEVICVSCARFSYGSFPTGGWLFCTGNFSEKSGRLMCSRSNTEKFLLVSRSEEHTSELQSPD